MTSLLVLLRSIERRRWKSVSISLKTERGKVDFAIRIDKDATTDATPINAALVQNYYQQIKKISAETGIPEPTDWYSTLLRLPDVTTKTDVEELSDEEWEVAKMQFARL